MIGRATDLELSDDGFISANVEMFSGYESLLDTSEFSPVGFGYIGPDGKVDEFIIKYFTLTPKVRD